MSPNANPTKSAGHRTMVRVDTAAALATGSTTRPPLPQPWASALPFMLGSAPTAALKPPASPPVALPRLRTCAPTRLQVRAAVAT